MKTKTKRIYLLIFALVTMVTSAKAASVPYAELIYDSNASPYMWTLYFKCGELPETTSYHYIYDLSVKNESGFAYWYGFSPSIQRVVFDSSFSSVQLESTDVWFKDCESLILVEGMEYFDASKVGYARYMFSGCKRLTSVDMSSFKPKTLRECSGMFSGCTLLKSVDLSGVDFTGITKCYNMFSGCEKLETVELGGSGYNNSSYLSDCKCMFEDCKNLTTIYCPYALQLKSTGNTTSAYMFKNCLNLQGAVKYQLGNDDISYANPETGYFTIKPVPLGIKLIGQDVTNINCGDLTAIPGVTGTASYDSETNTLYLENASIAEMTLAGGYAIENGIDSLKINVVGDCSISSTAGTGIKNTSKTLIINGTGTLNITGEIHGINMTNTAVNYLVIDGNVTVNVTAGHYGMQGVVTIQHNFKTGEVTTMCPAKLKVGGTNSKLSVKGTDRCFMALGGFIAADGYEVTSPSRTAYYGKLDGADYFTFCRLSLSFGKELSDPTTTLTPVAGTAVVIEKTVTYQPGDVNHDGSITMADANAVVNYFLATDKPSDFDKETADVNGDGSITMADANMIVNMFLGQ